MIKIISPITQTSFLKYDTQLDFSMYDPPIKFYDELEINLENKNPLLRLLVYL